MPQRSNPPPTVATVDLLAQYELLQSLGGSERASVHRARDRVLGQVVAIKLLREERGHDPDRVARYYRLARAAANLGHPNIVAVYDHGSAWHTAFITMEYVAGRDLAALLDREGALPPRRAAAIVVQVLDALAAAYGAGLVHGDLHPHNVLLRDGTDAVVLTDFGMASLLGPTSPRQREANANAAYRAPELAQGAPTSPAADIYAVGALLRAALTTPPARPGPATRQHAALVAALLEIAQRALDPDPAARYPSAEIMRADLLAITGPLAMPVIAPAPQPAPQHGHSAAPAM